MIEDGSPFASSLEWLLEAKDAGVRYLALRDLVKMSTDDPELKSARREAHENGSIAKILKNMNSEGYWVEPGPGYYKKYRSTVWAVILLAQLGASVNEDVRVKQACNYLLEHTFAQGGYFTLSGAPSGTIDCLQGNLCWALTELGMEDPRLDDAFEWMACSQTGEGIAPKTDRNTTVRYYAHKCGPGFQCGANYNLPCAWGATKVMLAFSRLPSSQYTDLIKGAIQRGVEFIFSVDPVSASWPYKNTISRNWRKFGFPVFYNTDLLQVAEAMTALGYGNDPRLASVIQLIRDKQDAGGQWALEYDYSGKTWGNYGVKGKSNKWVTLRALRVLHAIREQPTVCDDQV
jgi:hypothetical protein